jgi:hypothetical protein
MGKWLHTCIEAGDGSGLFARGRNIALVAALYPVAILQAHSRGRHVPPCPVPWAQARGADAAS